MKVCLNAWQDKEYLEKADELKVPWDKREIIPEIFEQYPNKIVVLEYLGTDLTEEEYNELNMYKGLGRGNFKMCVASITLLRDRAIPFYLGYPISDLYTIMGLMNIGVTDIKIEGPLVFNLASVKNLIKDTDINIRIVPNVAYTNGLPYKDGVLGSWIRPEDLSNYEELIDVIEFENIPTKAKEQALYRLYMEDKEWDGNLSDLITNLNYPGLNRMIPTTMSCLRKNCKQACLSGSNCKICYRMLYLANPDLYKNIKEQTSNE
jgi:hypothetical protein